MSSPEQRQRREPAQVGNQQRVIIKIDPRTVEDILFRQMAYQISEETPIQEIPPEVETVKELPTRAAILIHFLTKHYMSTVLGGQIISPYMGRDIALDRIIQYAEMLLSVLYNRLQELEKEIRAKKMRGEDFEKEVHLMLDNMEIILIVVREITNRILTAMHINSPPPLRPPLVNVKLGYDKQD